MSYKTCITNLISVLQKISEFNDSNVADSDYRILNKGKPFAIVLNPGPFTSEVSTMGGDVADYWVDWQVRIELYVRYDNDVDASDRISTLRQLILEQIMKYPRLDAAPGVFLAYIKSGAQPVPVFQSDGSGPWFWQQLMVCSIREDVSSITANE